MKVLIIVDAQNDFMPGGSLAVPAGDLIVPIINEIQHKFDLIVATQDWHPQNHGSFASNHPGKKPFDKIIMNGLEQALWPSHCVQGSTGALFHPELDMNAVEAIFRKGLDPKIDSYSGFYDNRHQKSIGLAGYLREKGAKELFFCGLAADICVYYTIQDALKEGFKVGLIMEATMPLDQETFSAQQEKLRTQEVTLLRATDLI